MKYNTFRSLLLNFKKNKIPVHIDKADGNATSGLIKDVGTDYIIIAENKYFYECYIPFSAITEIFNN